MVSRLRNPFRLRIQEALSAVAAFTFGDAAQHGHAEQRNRRVMYTVAAAAGARAVSLLTVFISVPLTVKYLGPERYGMWTTMASVLALFSFADFGVGNGLLNAISGCHGRGDKTSARRYVASALALQGAIAVGVACVFAVAYPLTPWSRIFNVSDPLAVAEAGPASAVFFACFLASIPLSVVQRVQQGYQEGFIDSVWVAGGKIAGLAALLLVVTVRAGLPWLVFAVVGVPVIATALNGLVLFLVRKPFLRPRADDVRSFYAKRIMNAGFLFLIVQLASALAYSGDNLIIAHLIGPESVAEYAVTLQMFSFGPVLLSMFLTSLWPAYGEAMARGDSQWIRNTFRRSIGIGLAVNVPYALVLIFFGNTLLHAWVGPQITAPARLLIAFAIWTMMNSFNGSIAVLLNGLNIMRFQAISASLMTCVNLLLSIYLTQVIGISGVIWGSIIAQTFFVLIPSGIYVSRLMRRMFETSGGTLQPRTIG
jgi:O-antigen/teichoic acid export membrane protein